MGKCSRAGAGLAAADALAAGWLDERGPIDAGYLMKTAEVYPSGGF